MTRKTWLSVAMDAAIKSWCLRPDASTTAQVAAHAVAHGVSVAGLRMALTKARLLDAPKARAPRP